MTIAASRTPAPVSQTAAKPKPAPPTPSPSRVSRPETRPARLPVAEPAVRLARKKSRVPGTTDQLPGEGEPMSPGIREAIEESLNVDLKSVRVHTDARAQSAAKDLSARAFTYGPHIFLGRGESPKDVGLMAHETAHVIQQQNGPAVQGWSSGQTDSYEREAHEAASAVSRHEEFTVGGRTPGPRLQRWGMSDILNSLAEEASLIPGFRLLTLILGVNPISMEPVKRSAANILRALVELMPGGALITQALDNHGILEKVGQWVEKQLAALGLSAKVFKNAISEFLGSFKWSDIASPSGVWKRARRIFTEPIARILNFAKGLVGGIVKFIKDAVLRPLARLAAKTRGYDLLKAILGEDPVTGDPYPRTAETLIGGFMKLIGQEDVWKNIKKANAVARAWAWFQGAVKSLVGFVKQIPKLFVKALQSLELIDIILVPRAFIKVASVFGGFIGDFISWAGNAVWTLLQIIFEVLMPGAIPYLKKAGAAFKTILKNPVGFVGNLVKAAKLGFRQFASKFGTHLKNSLIKWITGALAGANIYIPQSLEFRELIKFVLSVLGLTWQNIRRKLVKVLGEPAVKAMEIGFDLVVTLVREGPAAAWEKIKEQLSDLRDMVLEGIISFVSERIVQAAVTKLLSMLSPAGAFIQAVIAIYNTVMFFIERMKQIIQVAMAFIDSISAIARGVLAAAANRVEQTLAGLLTLAVSFLARIAGLGKVSDAVIKIIDKLRARVDKAIDKVIDWIVNKAKKLLGKILGKKEKPDERTEEQKKADLGKAMAESESELEMHKDSEKTIKRGLRRVATKYRVASLTLVTDKESDGGKVVHVEGKINPAKKGPSHQIIVGKGWKVGLHKDVKKGGKHSHHVPVKVLKTWIANVLSQVKDSSYQERAKELEQDPDGNELSAIQISAYAHKTIHKSKPPEPADMVAARNLLKRSPKAVPRTKLISITTRAGKESYKPLAGTIGRSVEETEPKLKAAVTTSKFNLSLLTAVFKRAFYSLLVMGIAAVRKAKLKDSGWMSPLCSLAVKAWESVITPPKPKH